MLGNKDIIKVQAPLTSLRLKLEHFEGPLDLLLFLTKKMEVDLYDIPIAEITKQYMEYIHSWQENNLNISGEYLVMASTLMVIKSQMLLPSLKNDSVAQEDLDCDPRKELAQQLAEYQNFKVAAKFLSKSEEERSFHFTKLPSDLAQYQENKKLPVAKYTTIDLFTAILQVLDRKKNKELSPIKIFKEKVKINDCILLIKKQLKDQGNISFNQLFNQDPSVEIIVTTFLALLELLKLGMVQVWQKSDQGMIEIFKNDEFGVATEIISGN